MERSEFFPEVAIDERAAEAMARGLWAVAAVDGVHQREAALVASFFHDVGGGAAALAELGRRAPITSAELAATLHGDEERRLFVKTALLLAWADGRVTPEEERIIAEFATALGVDEATRAELAGSVKEYLLGHLSHVHNTDATVKVAKKLGV